MKYFIILGIIALIFYAFLIWRLRRYFPIARQIFQITRQLYSLTRSRDGAAPVQSPKRKTDGEKLLRCASCGTWIPADRALQLKSEASVYCSTSCLEQAASPITTEARRSAKG